MDGLGQKERSLPETALRVKAAGTGCDGFPGQILQCPRECAMEGHVQVAKAWTLAEVELGRQGRSPAALLTAPVPTIGLRPHMRSSLLALASSGPAPRTAFGPEPCRTPGQAARL